LKKKIEKPSFSEEKEAKRLPKGKILGKRIQNRTRQKAARYGQGGFLFGRVSEQREHGGSNPLHEKINARTKQKRDPARQATGRLRACNAGKGSLPESVSPVPKGSLLRELAP